MRIYLAPIILVATVYAAGLAAQQNTTLPTYINTAQGQMHVENTYIPGVVQAEMAWVPGSWYGVSQAQLQPALEAQAISARTYLLRALNTNGMTWTVPIGPHFQAWNNSATQRAKDSATATAGQVMTYQGYIINANYNSGAWPVDSQGMPFSPSAYSTNGDGYSHFSTWSGLRNAWVNANSTGAYTYGTSYWNHQSNIFAWTWIFVTINEGKTGNQVTRTVQASNSIWNRGAMGQYRAMWLAGKLNYSTVQILRYFYGADITVTGAGSTPPPPSVPAPPSGLSPTGGATVTSASVDLTWNASSGATAYDVNLEAMDHSVGASGYSHYHTWNDRTGTSFTVWPAYWNAGYRFRLRAKNSAGAGNWSAWSYFQYSRGGGSSGTYPEANTGFMEPIVNDHTGYDFLDWGTVYAVPCYHPGLDSNGPGWGDADLGNPVYAAANGIVRYVNGASWGGLVIEHNYQGSIYYSQYGHCQNISVQVGDHITKGQQVAEIGKVGASSAHLHWEIRNSNHPNPTYGPYWNSTGFQSTAWITHRYEDPAAFVASHGPYGGTTPPSVGTPGNLLATVVNGTTVSFDWSAASNANGYWLDIAESAANLAAGPGAPTFQHVSTGTGTSYTWSGLTTGTTYYWRVFAYNSNSGVHAYPSPAGVTPTGSSSTTPPAPTGLSATVLGTDSIQFAWNASTGATGYYVDIAQTQNDLYNFGATFQNHSTTATSHTWTGLSPGTTYWWRVYAHNGSTGSHGIPNPPTVTTQSNTTNPPPAPTGLTATVLGSTSVSLSWTGSSGASYYVDIALTSGDLTNGNGSFQNHNNGTSTSYTWSGLSAGTTYYWRVWAYNSAGGNHGYPTPATFTTSSSGGGTPTGLSPDGWVSITTSNVDLAWNAVGGASSYEVRIEHRASASSAWAYYYTYYPGANGQTFFPQIADQQWRWQVRSYAGSWGAWSAWAHFNHGNAGATTPPAPTGLSPANWATASTSSVTLSWNGSGSPSQYEVVIEYRPSGSTTWNYYYTYYTTSDFKTYWPSVSGYQWRFAVRGQNSQGWGAWSSWAYFNH